jgi:hypothetical protein
MRKLVRLSALTLFTLLASRTQLAAQQDPSTAKTPKYPYKLIDLGTFGGPRSYQSANGEATRILNNAGVVSSYADTTAPDPFAPNFCFDADCLVAHAYRWHDGVLQDLGVLAKGYSSLVASINDLGWGSVHTKAFGVADPRSITIRRRKFLICFPRVEAPHTAPRLKLRARLRTRRVRRPVLQLARIRRRSHIHIQHPIGADVERVHRMIAPKRQPRDNRHGRPRRHNRALRQRVAHDAVVDLRVD